MSDIPPYQTRLHQHQQQRRIRMMCISIGIAACFLAAFAYAAIRETFSFSIPRAFMYAVGIGAGVAVDNRCKRLFGYQPSIASRQYLKADWTDSPEFGNVESDTTAEDTAPED